MKILYNHASPFSRKARVLAIELGLINSIELEDTGLISPIKPNGTVTPVNPIGKVPVLITDDGVSITDSRVICEFLDSEGKGDFFPKSAPERFIALTLQALADDALTTSVAVRYEIAHRPKGTIWDEWVSKQKSRVSRTIDHFADVQHSFENTLNIGTVAVACVLGYVNFRELDDTWDERNPHLSAWFTKFDNRESMQRTRPSPR